MCSAIVAVQFALPPAVLFEYKQLYSFAKGFSLRISQPIYIVTFSWNFNCLVCFIVACLCLLRALRELP